MEILIVLMLIGAGVFAGARLSRRGLSTTTSQGKSKPNRDQSDSDSDAWEGSFWEVTDERTVNARLQIAYVDGKGNRTTRKVDVRQYGMLGDHGLLIGHCELRGATRTFRFDRVRSCIDITTGEAVQDIGHHLANLHAQMPERAAERVRAEESDTLKILYYLAKADGQFRADERVIVISTVQKLVADSRLNDKMIETILRDLGVPSLQGFKLAVGRMAKQSIDRKAIILDAARNMVATQGTVAPAEAEAMAYIEKRLA